MERALAGRGASANGEVPAKPGTLRTATEGPVVKRMESGFGAERLPAEFAEDAAHLLGRHHEDAAGATAGDVSVGDVEGEHEARAGA